MATDARTGDQRTGSLAEPRNFVHRPSLAPRPAAGPQSLPVILRQLERPVCAPPEQRATLTTLLPACTTTRHVGETASPERRERAKDKTCASLPGSRRWPATASARCSVTPPGARATGSRSAAWSTACPRACRSPSRTSSAGWTGAGPASRSSPPSGASRIRSRSSPAPSRARPPGAPIALVIENVDQRGKDYGAIKDQFRPGHADFTYHAKYGIRDYRGGGRASARETAMRVAAGAIARKVLGDGISIKGALIQIGQDRIDRAKLELERGREQPVLVSRSAAAERWEALLMDVRKRGSSAGAVIEVVASGVPAGPRRARLRQARCRSRQGDHEHQRGQGGRDRRRLRRGGARGRGQRRRDPDRQRRPAAVPVQQRRRHPRRHLDRPGRRGPLRGQADQLDPDPAPLDRPLRQRGRGRRPRAATIPASASARSRSARRCWRSCSPTTCCASARSVVLYDLRPPRARCRRALPHCTADQRRA